MAEVEQIHVRVRFINEWTSRQDDRHWTVQVMTASSDGVLTLEFLNGRTLVFGPRHRWVLVYPNPIDTESSHG